MKLLSVWAHRCTRGAAFEMSCVMAARAAWELLCLGPGSGSEDGLWPGPWGHRLLSALKLQQIHGMLE